MFIIGYYLVKNIFCTSVDLSLGRVELVWQEAVRPRLLRLVLPESRRPGLPVSTFYHGANRGSHPEIDSIVRLLHMYDDGKDVKFSFADLNMQGRGDFHRRVWWETFCIPIGKVSTYGNVAKKISAAGAARAVGTALSQNLFPLIVPCHRVIRANGETGNFSSGGEAMKRRILEKEGIVFDEKGRVLSEYII